MPDIALATINARYLHTAFGLRYLHANLGELQERAVLLEFDSQQRPLEIVERVLAHRPRVLGLGVYIWNVTLSTEVVRVLKHVAPDVVVILGGPEVSHELEDQPIVEQADYVVTGEGEVVFADLCRSLLAGQRPPGRIHPGGQPDLTRLVLPYPLYDARDIAHRTLYVEASRGCPFHCEFCLSSLDHAVRPFPLPALLGELERLLERGARQFKFVDRTFNLNAATSETILRFFLDRYRPGLFLHFEMIPDRFPEPLRACAAQFPAGALQFEVGIQTWDPEVADRIGRRQDNARIEENLRFLRRETGVHLHADLIVGLPGEDLAGFARGFDRLLALDPHEIQIGILKRLRGTAIDRHTEAWDMCYSPLPPYEILRNRLLDFQLLQRLRRLARYWDIVANSGRFPETARRLWRNDTSAFQGVLRFADWLHARLGRSHSIALEALSLALRSFLVEETGQAPAEVDAALARDQARRRDAERGDTSSDSAPPAPGPPTRQRRHRAGLPPNKKPGPLGPG